MFSSKDTPPAEKLPQVIKNEYGGGVTLILPEERHDPTPEEREAQRKADRITEDELIRAHFGGNRQAFVIARDHFGLKEAALNPVSSDSASGRRFLYTPYSRERFARWKAEKIDLVFNALKK